MLKTQDSWVSGKQETSVGLPVSMLESISEGNQSLSHQVALSVYSKTAC